MGPLLQFLSDGDWGHQEGSLPWLVVGSADWEVSCGSQSVCLTWLLHVTWGLLTAWELGSKGEYPQSELSKRFSHGCFKVSYDSRGWILRDVVIGCGRDIWGN